MYIKEVGFHANTFKQFGMPRIHQDPRIADSTSSIESAKTKKHFCGNTPISNVQQILVFLSNPQ